MKITIEHTPGRVGTIQYQVCKVRGPLPMNSEYLPNDHDLDKESSSGPLQ